MWVLSKHSRQMALEHSQLQWVILQRTAELQSLSQRLLKVQDEERRKLSRDLHDTTGQTLDALKISVSFLQERCNEDPSTTILAAEVADLADQAIEEIRTASYLLHPPLLEEVGFARAAESYVDGFAKRTGLCVKVDIAPADDRLPIGMEIALFKVLQETLTNVHRHSRASEVSVCFLHKLEKIVLEIRDNGLGIPAELGRLREGSEQTGVGLAGMRERMNQLKGNLEIESDGHGTTMRAIVPFSPMTRSAAEIASHVAASRRTRRDHQPNELTEVTESFTGLVLASEAGHLDSPLAFCEETSQNRVSQSMAWVAPRFGLVPASAETEAGTLIVSYDLGWWLDRDNYGLTVSKANLNGEFHAGSILPEAPLLRGFRI